MPPFVSDNREGVTLKVQVQVRASRDEVVGPQGTVLRVRITAAPVAGAANRHLLRFLAKKLKVPRNQMIIQAGETARVKSIGIQGISADTVRQRLLQ